MTRMVILMVTLCTLLPGPAVEAQEAFDGTNDLVCAATRALSCVSNFKCETGLPSSYNVPQFATFRFERRAIELTYSPEKTQSFKMQEIHPTRSTIVVMGVIPDGGAYTFEIHRRKGTLFASGIQPEGFSFFIAGACKR